MLTSRLGISSSTSPKTAVAPLLFSANDSPTTWASKFQGTNSKGQAIGKSDASGVLRGKAMDQILNSGTPILCEGGTKLEIPRLIKIL